MRARSVVALLLFPFARLQAQAVWTVDPKPMVDIQGLSAGGQVNFENSAGATRLRDGSLLIADRGPNSIRLFDAKGALVKAVGRTGQGPGEYQAINVAVGCGPDSLLVWEINLGRASMVGPTGEIGRRFKIPADTDVLMSSANRNGVRRPLLSISCGDHGTISYISDPTGVVPSESREFMSMLTSAVTTGRDGHLLAHVDSLPFGQMACLGRGCQLPRPLGTFSSVATIGDRTVVGVSDSARVILLDKSGRRSTMPVPVQTRAPTRDEFDAAVNATASIVPAAMRQQAVTQLSGVAMPALAPTYSGLFNDPAGLLWIQTSLAGSKATTLLAMQLDGRAVARVTVPTSMTVYEIGRDYILGTYSDANDEMHIAVYKLTRK